MITDTHTIPVIKQSRKRDYVFLLDDLEMTMHKDQLKRVTESWNDGKDIEDIAKKERRNVVEILLALIHQAKRGCKVRPFARLM